VPLKILECH